MLEVTGTGLGIGLVLVLIGLELGWGRKIAPFLNICPSQTEGLPKP